MRNVTSIRSSLRGRRNNLSEQQRDDAAISIAHHLVRHPLFAYSQRIAVYLPVRGEADPCYTIERAWSIGKSLFLPVLAPFGNRLWFLPYQPDTPLAQNRYGILEPNSSATKRAPPSGLNLILTPLVAFDRLGNRLGMGGGYYDRSFAFLNRRRHWQRPFLLGVGYQTQEVDRLTPDSWDIPLDGVVTETGVRIFR